MKKISAFLILIIAFSDIQVNAQLVIAKDTNTVQLVNNFILAGVTTSNVVYTGDVNTLGTFSNGGTTNIGLNDGIIMTTGTLIPDSIIGSPVSNYASTDNNGASCPELEALVSGAVTYDASILEFDLVPVGNVLEFQYVFASEEYPEYVCSVYNDVFGFFINGTDPAGGNYVSKNIAIVPGTTLPVAINTINNGITGMNGTADNCTSLDYASIYVDNETLNGQSIVFDGFTTVLTAQIFVVPGSSYHLKMAIADVSDGIYDSGIFLKTKSMKSYNSTTGIDEEQVSVCGIYADAANNKIEVSLPVKSEINILNIEGKVLKSITTEENHISVDMSDFARGMYFIKVQNNNGLSTKKFIKE
ncbi:MAG TPA: choice-of-anchor L domain-containing protein [Bacteroidales bacterium]|nr:choice-of-anchor L domain-containing protein [Bacteroidales bacterium]HPS17951.1 choice-of-anchor L domain-containing protein [Bacteroidales bacterium]